MSFEVQFPFVIDPDYLLDDKQSFRPMMPDAYIRDILMVITKISASEVGRIVIHTLKLWGHYVRITPNRISPFLASPRDSCLGGEAAPGEDQDLIYNRTVRPMLNNAFGVKLPPIRAVVRFIPSMYATGGACHTMKSSKSFSNYLPSLEEVLVHELIHAIRMISGSFVDQEATKGLSLYDAKEEFIAVLVTNIFNSEVKGNIRSSHHGHSTLDKQLEGSFEFFKASKNTFPYVEHFCRTSPHFSKRLCKVNVPFNPIHAFYHNPKKCRDFSNSQDAVMRDAGPFGIFSTLTPWLSWEIWKQVL